MQNTSLQNIEDKDIAEDHGCAKNVFEQVSKVNDGEKESSDIVTAEVSGLLLFLCHDVHSAPLQKAQIESEAPKEVMEVIATVEKEVEPGTVEKQQ